MMALRAALRSATAAAVTTTGRHLGWNAATAAELAAGSGRHTGWNGGVPRSQQTQAGPEGGAERTRRVNLFTAVNDALSLALDEDDRTLVFGEDVSFGGVFRCTTGLLEKYGAERVFNTPLCEQGIVGFAIGAAAMGYRPVVEIQFADYVFPAFDQLVNEAAKYRYRSGGIFNCGGLTVRMPCGAVGHGGHYHSQSPEAFFTHAPGLKVVMPSGPRDAKGLLLASIRDDNPVVFFEPKIMYRTSVEDVPLGDFEVPLGKAKTVRAGSDVTLVGWGSQVGVLMQAAEEVASDGIDAEVIDLRTLLPWDTEAVVESVNRTGRLLVSHEAPITSGFGAEVVSTIAKECFLRLEAPPSRICGVDVPFPLVLETAYLPRCSKIVEEIKHMVNY